MTNLQELMQQASRLTIDEKRALGKFLLEQAGQDANSGQTKNEEPNGKAFERPDMVREREHRWLTEHWKEYLDQYVCLEGEQLISYGPDGRKVFAEAKAAGIRVPFMVRVEDPTIPQMGGW